MSLTFLIKIFLGSAYLIAVMNSLAHAIAEAPQTPNYLTFEQASKIALGENPDLIAIRDQEDALSYRSSQALAPNNPTLGINKEALPGLSPFSTGATTRYEASMTLGFPGKALTQSRSFQHQSEATREQALAKEIEILTGLSNTYVALAANERMFRFFKEQEQKARDLLKLLEKKYATAQAAKVDLLNARVVLANVQHDLIVNQNERKLLITQFLNRIRKPGVLNLLPRIPDEITTPDIKQNLDELIALMQKNRQSLRSAQKLLNATSAAFTSAILSPFPDLQITAGINLYNVPSAEQVPGISRDYSVGIGIAIPIFFPFNELSGIRAATKERHAAQSNYDSQYLNALADLQNLYTTYFAIRSELDNLSQIVIPATRANYDLMVLTYSLGKSDFFRLNDAREKWIQAEKDYVSRKLAAAQTFNQLTQQVGCDLTKRDGPHACL